MSLVPRFDPPAFLPDFNSMPGMPDAWHRAVSGCFDAAVARIAPKVKNEAGTSGTVPFYNPATLDPGGTVIEQAVTWNAFPKALLRQYGSDQALNLADQLWTLSRFEHSGAGMALGSTFCRPQDEYCEWHVQRDPATGKIVRVTFTSEPPEYWQALYGETLTTEDNKQFPFPGGSPEKVLELYRALVSPDVQLADLVAPEDIGPDGAYALKGHYNPYNKWNTTHGIVHLNCPPNSLVAEVTLGADACLLRKDGRGRLLVEPEALICCTSYGGPDRNSDPTIGAAVNSLARLGAYVTLRNPVGLYMDHIDLAGWVAPDKQGVADCVQIVRGTPQMIERLVVEVPTERGFTVSDITIDGAPIQYGGQIAGCITVKLIGLANVLAPGIRNAPLPCAHRCCIDPHHPIALGNPVSFGSPAPAGKVAAFGGEGEAESALAAPSPPRRPGKSRS